MLAILEQILSYLVEHPKEMQITQFAGQKTVIFELRCNKKDIGKIIGKNGKTVNSIRAILSSLAARDGQRAVFEVVE